MGCHCRLNTIIRYLTVHSLKMPIGNIPPVEYEMAYYRQLEKSDEVAWLRLKCLRKNRADSIAASPDKLDGLLHQTPARNVVQSLSRWRPINQLINLIQKIAFTRFLQNPDAWKINPF